LPVGKTAIGQGRVRGYMLLCGLGARNDKRKNVRRVSGGAAGMAAGAVMVARRVMVVYVRKRRNVLPLEVL
jgi:hypothetical protein